MKAYDFFLFFGKLKTNNMNVMYCGLFFSEQLFIEFLNGKFTFERTFVFINRRDQSNPLHTLTPHLKVLGW